MIMILSVYTKERLLFKEKRVLLCVSKENRPKLRPYPRASVP